MYIKLLTNTGLTNAQAEILACVLEFGEQKASEIAKKIKRPRGVVYNGLEELIEMGLAEKKENNRQIARFRAEHPSKLEKLLDLRKKDLEQNKKQFENELPNLISLYNLTVNKPGVRFFEGEEGIKKVLEDNLKSKTEIYTLVNLKAVDENLKKINDEYVERRIRLGIKKKVIAEDTLYNRKFANDFKDELTKFKFISKKLYPFETIMQIYDNRISYQTIERENKIAILIEDKNIYQMHKSFFEFMWDSLPYR
ncbi:MAG: helix-turn-helix domain-containing protein [bacterium]